MEEYEKAKKRISKLTDEEVMKLTKEKEVLQKKMKAFICINCKQEFRHIPVKKSNECPSGYYHDIILKSSIIERKPTELIDAKEFEEN